jgi:hypothetical protein
MPRAKSSICINASGLGLAWALSQRLIVGRVTPSSAAHSCRVSAVRSRSSRMNRNGSALALQRRSPFGSAGSWIEQGSYHAHRDDISVGREPLVVPGTPRKEPTGKTVSGTAKSGRPQLPPQNPRTKQGRGSHQKIGRFGALGQSWLPRAHWIAKTLLAAAPQMP